MNRSFVLSAGAVALAAFATPTTFGQATERHIFVCNNGNNEGSVSSMKVANDGTLTFVDKLITGPDGDPGENAQCISITPNGKYLCTGHGTISTVNEQLTFIEVHANGTMTQVAEFLTPDSPIDVQWLDDQYIAVTDTPANVIVYQFNPAVPSLTAIDTEVNGGFSTWLILDPAGRYLYTQDSTNDTVRSYLVNANGTLTAVDTVSTSPVFPLGIGISPDGTRIYGGGGISNSGNKIIGVDVNNTNGDLSIMAGQPFISPGVSPKQVVVSMDGRFAIAAHGTDSTIRTFEIDQGTGALTSTGFMYDIGDQGSLGEVAVMPTATRGGGTLVFAADRYTSTDGVRGVRSFTLGSDGSLNQNGTIVDTTGITPWAISVWDPPAVYCATDLTNSSGGGPDGDVNVFDLFVLLANWNTSGPGAAIAPPTNVVDVFDLFALLADWGTCSP